MSDSSNQTWWLVCCWGSPVNTHTHTRARGQTKTRRLYSPSKDGRRTTNWFLPPSWQMSFAPSYLVGFAPFFSPLVLESWCKNDFPDIFFPQSSGRLRRCATIFWEKTIARWWFRVDFGRCAAAVLSLEIETPIFVILCFSSNGLSNYRFKRRGCQEYIQGLILYQQKPSEQAFVTVLTRKAWNPWGIPRSFYPPFPQW